MRTVSLLAASLIASFPLAAVGQVMDGPPTPGTVLAPPGAVAPPSGPIAPVAKIEKSGSYFGFSFGTGRGTLAPATPPWTSTISSAPAAKSQRPLRWHSEGDGGLETSSSGRR